MAACGGSAPRASRAIRAQAQGLDGLKESVEARRLQAVFSAKMGGCIAG